jgi:hypothetical protein
MNSCAVKSAVACFPLATANTVTATMHTTSAKKLELELELIQTHMTQKPLLWVELLPMRLYPISLVFLRYESVPLLPRSFNFLL